MFDGSVNLTLEIEKRTKNKTASYLDAVMDVCEEFEIDPTSIAKYLTKPMIEKIKIEAGSRHLLRSKEKGKSPRLPL